MEPWKKQCDGVQRRGKGWWLVVGKSTKKGGNGGWKGWMVSPINTSINNAVCGVLSHKTVEWLREASVMD